MPRLRLRKALLLLVGLVFVTFFFFHLTTHQVQRSGEAVLSLIRLTNDHQLALSADDLNNINLLNRRSSYKDDVRFLEDQQLSSVIKPWFMVDGKTRPQPAVIDPDTDRRVATLFPEESDDDRIVDQLMYVPPDYPPKTDDNVNVKLKKILMYNGLANWRPLKVGRSSFLENKCPVDTCEVVTDRNEAETADAILFTDNVIHGSTQGSKRPWWQVWILYLLECPFHTHSFPYKNVFNWTATYRRDSDIVAPYEKFVPYDKSKRIRLRPVRNYAVNKTKKVAWFVSNCGAQNGRNAYAAQLGKHIQVDIYGTCGKLQCPRNDQTKCFSLLNNDYKFYLSFENSNCKDYITEKFFVNGLGNDVLPIVLGAPREDYRKVAPPYSYIHVDDFDSPKQLADYLHLLDNNDTLYNEYFRWKGTGEFVNTYFWCRVCAMLHDKYPVKNYPDINEWWRGNGVCDNKKWSF